MCDKPSRASRPLLHFHDLDVVDGLDQFFLQTINCSPDAFHIFDDELPGFKIVVLEVCEVIANASLVDHDLKLGMDLQFADYFSLDKQFQFAVR